MTKCNEDTFNIKTSKKNLNREKKISHNFRVIVQANRLFQTYEHFAVYASRPSSKIKLHESKTKSYSEQNQNTHPTGIPLSP